MEPAEAAAVAEHRRLGDTAIAARLQATLGARRSDLLQAEHTRLLETAGEVERHAAKKARVEETKAGLVTLRQQVKDHRGAHFY